MNNQVLRRGLSSQRAQERTNSGNKVELTYRIRVHDVAFYKVNLKARVCKLDTTQPLLLYISVK